MVPPKVFNYKSCCNFDYENKIALCTAVKVFSQIFEFLCTYRLFMSKLKNECCPILFILYFAQLHKVAQSIFTTENLLKKPMLTLSISNRFPLFGVISNNHVKICINLIKERKKNILYVYYVHTSSFSLPWT